MSSDVSDIENDLQVTWHAIVNNGVGKDPATRLWRLHGGNVLWHGDVRELYNRKCYDGLLQDLKTKSRVLIKGTPGVGKSLFLLVVLVTIVEEAKASNKPIPSINYARYEGHVSKTYRLLPKGAIQNYLNPVHKLPDYLLSGCVDMNVADGRILSLEVT